MFSETSLFSHFRVSLNACIYCNLNNIKKLEILFFDGYNPKQSPLF